MELKKGVDTITGGGANDTFVFHDNFGNETITNFTTGTPAFFCP
jgi:Ca2+-binding RTX toxin-like protein